MGLGPAEAIAVTRRTNLHESTSGLRDNVTVLDHRVHVELANRLAVPVCVEVRERVPVTSDTDIRIEERADWTAPESRRGPGAAHAGHASVAGRTARRWHRRTRRVATRSGSRPARPSPAATAGADIAMSTSSEPIPLIALPVTAVTCTEDRAHLERTAVLDLDVRHPATAPRTGQRAGRVDRTLHAELTAGHSATVLDVRIVRSWTPRGPGPADDDSALRRRMTTLEEERSALEQQRDRPRARVRAARPRRRRSAAGHSRGRRLRGVRNAAAGAESWTGWTANAIPAVSDCARWKPGWPASPPNSPRPIGPWTSTGRSLRS
ncbi:hypothetical protein SHIRM173S_12577 [Streptomyces hirsutus]